jgi:hypothetical protein
MCWWCHQNSWTLVNILTMCHLENFNQYMFFIIYQHSRHFNLETLLMLRIVSGIFGKVPLSWKLLWTIYQFSSWVHLIGNCHYFILKLKNSNWNIVANHIWFKTFWLKKGAFLLMIIGFWGRDINFVYLLEMEFQLFMGWHACVLIGCTHK